MNDPSRNRFRNVIIIEDEPAHAEALRRYLSTSENDCAVKIAGTLAEFNQMVEQIVPDIVIADINLPDGTAFSLLRSDPEDQQWPVLIMTSYGDEEVAVKAIKSGALDYLVKSPEAFRNITHVINRNLREWRIIQQSRESERKFRFLFETMEQGVIYQDYNMKISAANPAAQKITGYSLAEMQNSSFFEEGPWFDISEDGNVSPSKIHPSIVANQTGEPVKERVMGFQNPAEDRFVWLLVSSRPYFRKQVFTTFTDITEMKLSELALKNAKQKAEESDRLKSVFMANMSHEIRTPMNGILGFSDLLKTPELSGESQKMYIEAINSSGKRMLDIINDLIDISKIEAGQTEVRNENTSIPDLLRELVLFFKPEADKKNITLKTDIRLPSSEFSINTDRTKLAQIITNLVKNALKFTHSGGTIELACRIKDERSLILSVKDNGTGVRKELQDKIFERFRQGDRADEHDGVGLGLAISRAYVEMLGGIIGIESEPGKGSDFFFTLPLPVIPGGYMQKEGGDIKPGMPHQLNILVAEDDEISYFLIKETLTRNNITPLHATNGREAVNIVKSGKDIDLILMDIKLPVMNGLDATREIKKINPGIPVIAQSAYVSQEEIQRSIEAGCDDYISKPVDIKELFRKIMRFNVVR
ncbi:MAG: response regulator [Methanosarcina sp.]